MPSDWKIPACACPSGIQCWNNGTSYVATKKHWLVVNLCNFITSYMYLENTTNSSCLPTGIKGWNHRETTKLPMQKASSLLYSISWKILCLSCEHAMLKQLGTTLTQQHNHWIRKFSNKHHTNLSHTVNNATLSKKFHRLCHWRMQASRSYPSAVCEPRTILTHDLSTEA